MCLNHVLSVSPVLYVVLGSLFLGGCLPLYPSHSLLAKYKAAACLPLRINPEILPRTTRYWDATVTIANGSNIVVKAAAMPGGRVTVTYVASGEQFVAADAGDYVYSDDIRFDDENDRLYIFGQRTRGRDLVSQRAV